MTEKELEQRVLERLDDNLAAPEFTTADEVRAALNEAQDLAALLTLSLEQTADVTIPAASPFFLIRAQLPDFLVPLRMEIANRRVEASTLAEMDALESSWQGSAGTPARYATLGFSLFAVTPQPASDTLVRLTYARSPIPMIGDDPVELDEAYQTDLCDYAVYRIWLKEGAEGLQRGTVYLNRFLDRMTALGDLVRQRSRAARYDVLPFELRLWDRAALVTQINRRNRKQEPTP